MLARAWRFKSSSGQFKDKKLAKISNLETWLLALKEKKGSSGNPAFPHHSKSLLNNLEDDAQEATRQGTIPSNPAAFIEQLKERPREKQILSIEEMRALFFEKTIDSVWEGDQRQFTLNLLAASTGMRIGETQALQIQHARSDHVAVVHSWARKYGLKDPKWGSARQIPIPRRTSKCLQSLIEESPYQAPDDLVFWAKTANLPCSTGRFCSSCMRPSIGLGYLLPKGGEETLLFILWRYLFNSICRARIPDYKLRRLTGHRTAEMTELYTHLDMEDLKDVIKIQEEIVT